jgi:hypothetical protein
MLDFLLVGFPIYIVPLHAEYFLIYGIKPRRSMLREKFYALVNIINTAKS